MGIVTSLLAIWLLDNTPLTVLECMAVSITQVFVVKTLPSFSGSSLNHSWRWNVNVSFYGMIFETVVNTVLLLNKPGQTTGENTPIFFTV